MKLLLCMTFLAFVATVFGGAVLGGYGLGYASPYIGGYGVGLGRTYGGYGLGYGRGLITSGYTTGIGRIGYGGYGLGGYGLGGYYG